MENAAYLREQAAKCRRLADSLDDPVAAAALRKMANDYDEQADNAEQRTAQMPPPEQEV